MHMTPDELVSIRERLGMERWELGEAIGYTGANARDTIGKWERGAKPIPAYRAEMMLALADGRPIPESAARHAKEAVAAHSRTALEGEDKGAEDGGAEVPSLRELLTMGAVSAAIIGAAVWLARQTAVA